MKKYFLFSLLLMALSIIATAQTKRIAILETIDKEDNVPYAVEVMVRSNLTKVISSTPGYEGYDRVNISEIMDEHDFERTGMVNEAQIRRLGEIAGADYLLISEAVKVDESNIFVTAKILNVETALTEGSENVLMGIKAQEIQNGCETLANRLLGLPEPVVTKPKKESKEPEPTVVETPKPEQVEAPKVTVTEPVAQYDNIITKINRKTYSQNGKIMDKSQFVDLIKNTCPEAYSYYKKGTTLNILGWVCLGAGCGLSMTMAGGFSSATVIAMDALVLGSIPFFIVGAKKHNNAYLVYNRACANSSTKLTVGPTPNGIGICLSF